MLIFPLDSYMKPYEARSHHMQGMSAVLLDLGLALKGNFLMLDQLGKSSINDLKLEQEADTPSQLLRMLSGGLGDCLHHAGRGRDTTSTRVGEGTNG